MKSNKKTESLIDDNLRTALRLLWQAYNYSKDTGTSVWDFAMEIEKLYSAAVTVNDIRWMVAKGYAIHAEETSSYGDLRRSFCPASGFSFLQATCFVLTEKGAKFAKDVLEKAQTQAPLNNQLSTTSLTDGKKVDFQIDRSFMPNKDLAGALKPQWDVTSRELSLGSKVVKRFRVPARNQELILGAFQEEGWPEHIDDPIPVSEHIDPQTRLHDAINRLNGHQTHALVRFHGNGNGTGVYWQLRQLN